MNPDRWLGSTDRSAFRRRLLRWFDRFGRDFPWRRTSDAYAVWVSEVMLQQTTTAMASGRFEAFLRRFPTVAALAAASEAEVLHSWEGLGYYRRARNLHLAAKAVVVDHQGVVPTDPNLLKKLPGLGRYSANAVACFARNERHAILEANTLRLWSRLCGVRDDPKKQPTLARLWRTAEAVMSPKRPRDFNLALMDVGSVVCTPRSPNCPECPLVSHCVAQRSGRPESFPKGPLKPEAVEETWVAVLLEDHGRYLIQQRGPLGRWAGMWEFPNAKVDTKQDVESAADVLADQFGITNRSIGRLPVLRHGVMHYRIRLHVFSYAVESSTAGEGPIRRWATPAEMTSLPFSSVHRKIVTFVSKIAVDESRRGGKPT
jgi:A/G-specific adenine glycosylase